MKYLIYHLRSPFRKFYVPVSLAMFFVLIYNLIFNIDTFDTVFNYGLGWFCLIAMIVIPNYMLIRSSIQDYKKDWRS